MNAATEPAAGRDDAFTLAALGAIAACTATVAHEAVGHGAACLGAGEHIRLLTSVYFRCSQGNPYIDIGGPLGNLAAGLIAGVGLIATPRTDSRVRLYCLFVMAFSLFWEAGYLLFAGVLDRGDWALALHALLGPDPTLVRAVAFTGGVALYLAASQAVSSGVKAVAGPTAFRSRLKTLLRWGWVGGALAAVLAAAMFDPDRGEAVRQAALEIGVAAVPLLFLPARSSPRAAAGTPPVAPRSGAWILAAVVIWIAFAATLGRGLQGLG
jgi:hypothetical protein